MPEFMLKDILPNPFRQLDRYPIQEDKIEALRESIQTTGFWDNVVARENGNGKAEIAFGHHRLETLNREFPPNHKINLIVRDLSDELMLKMMARENMEEWSWSASVEQETVRAVVQAFADGKIDLPTPSKAPLHHLRKAPSFRTIETPQGDRSGESKMYTSATIARFLGYRLKNWDAPDKIVNAVTALEFIEEGILSDEDFRELTTYQARALVDQARKIKRDREREAKAAAEGAKRADREAQEAARLREKAQKDAERAQKRRDEDALKQADEEALRQAELEAAAKRRRESKKKAEAKARQRAKDDAAKAGKAIGNQIREYKEQGVKRDAIQTAREVTQSQNKSKSIPDIDKYASDLAIKLHKLLQGDELSKSLDNLVTHREHLSPTKAEALQNALRKLGESVESYRLAFSVVEITDAEIVSEDETLYPPELER